MSALPHTTAERVKRQSTVSPHNRRLPVLLLTVSVFGVYCLTLNPTVYWGDGIELTAAATVLGVAHPTGYPLFMLLGKLFCSLPLGVVGWRMNLFCAASATLLAYVVYRIARLLFSRIGESDDLRDARVQWLAVFAAWAVAFSRAVWYQAGITEVYLLNAAGILVAIYLILMAGERKDPRFLFAAALWTGLLMGNQMLALCGAAAIFAAWLFAWFRPVFDESSVNSVMHQSKTAALCVVFGIIGLSVYAFLPIRAAESPPMNWGNPSSFEQFVWSVRGGDFRTQRLLRDERYRPFTFATWSNFAARRAKRLLHWTAQQWGRVAPEPGHFPFSFLGFIVFVAGAVGWSIVYRRHPLLFWSAAAAAALNLIVVFIYNIYDIEGYFIPLYALLLIGIFTALLATSNSLDRIQSAGKIPLIIAGLAPLWLFAVNSNYCDHRPDSFEVSLRGDRAYAVENYGREILGNLRYNALILTQGDNDTYALWYMQVVERRRLDVDVVGSQFLVNQPWYPATFGERLQKNDGKPPLRLIYFDHVPRTDIEFMKRIRNDMLLIHLPHRPVYTTFNHPALNLPVRQFAMDSLINTAVLNSPEAIFLPNPPYLFRILPPGEEGR